MRIEGSIVLVTGGVSGIGYGIAKNLIEKGAFVFVCDLNEEKGKSFESEFSGKTYFFKVDITNEDQVKNMVKEIENLKGRIDAVINSAGVALPGLIATTKDVHKTDIFKKLFEINTLGTFLVSKYCAKLMIDKNSVI